MKKISEIIEELEALKAEHGDVNVVVVADPDEQARSNPFLKLRRNEITHGQIHKIQGGYIGFKPEYDPLGEMRSKVIFIHAG